MWDKWAAGAAGSHWSSLMATRVSPLATALVSLVGEEVEPATPAARSRWTGSSSAAAAASATAGSSTSTGRTSAGWIPGRSHFAGNPRTAGGSSAAGCDSGQDRWPAAGTCASDSSGPDSWDRCGARGSSSGAAGSGPRHPRTSTTGGAPPAGHGLYLFKFKINYKLNLKILNPPPTT